MTFLRLGYERFIAMSVLIVLFPLAIYATPLFEVMLPDEMSRYELNTLALDLIETRENSAMVVGWPYDQSKLDQSGLSYRIENENIEEFYRNRLATGSGLDDLDEMGGYPTVAELYERAIEIAETYPDIVAGPDTIGYTFENRPIWVLKISDNVGVDEDEGEIFINGCIHAREVITPLIIMNLADKLTSEYSTNPRITDIVNNREIWLMPVMNVDGYMHNEVEDPNGGGMWRKNKRTINDALRGVDLNRNFPAGWGYDDTSSSPSPFSELYRGASPGSEPATQAVMAFCNDHNFNVAINYHAFMNAVLVPVSYNQSTSEHAEAHRLLVESYAGSLGWPTITPNYNGGAPDWMALEADNYIFSLLPEVGGNMDGFWPPLDRQPILIAEQEEPLLMMCEVAGDPFQFLPPTSPLVEDLPDTVGTEFLLTWQAGPDNQGNIAESYDILALSNETMVDNAELENNPTWKLLGFEKDNFEAYSGEYSYASFSQPNAVNYLISRESHMVEAGDTLSFWMKSYLFNGDSLFVQVETDLMTFALEGNLTTPTGNSDLRLAHVITGFQGEWVEAKFPLSSYVGSQVKFRMRHKSGTSQGITACQIDDISPIKTWENMTMLESGISDTSFVMNLTDVIQEGELTLGVRAHDIHDDISLVSNGVTTYFNPNYVDVHETTLPDRFKVGCAYPNPFNPSTSLNVTLPSVGQLTVSVFDILGRQVDLFTMGNCLAGQQIVNLNGSSWASGLYFIKVDFIGSNGVHHSDIQKAMLIK